VTTMWRDAFDRFADPAGARRVAQFAELLGRFPPGRLVDLGAGHGIFARVAADLGWQVTAIDARDERFPDDPRITWVTGDVRDFSSAGDFDVISCLGLWYHLTLEDQRSLAARCAPRPIILDTHVAMRDLADHPAHRRRVSKMLQRDGFTGRLYHETGMTTRATASVGNEYSFWPTTASLERLLAEAGYDVLERISPAVHPDRHFFIARTVADDVREQVERIVATYLPRAAAGRLAPAASTPAPTGHRPILARLASAVTRTGTKAAPDR